MAKLRVSPSASASRRRIRAPAAWKVATHSRWASRADQLLDAARASRRAALLVKVTARISRGRRQPLPDQVRDAVGDDARLPRPGARQDEQRPFAVAHGLELRRVEDFRERVGHRRLS